MGTARQDPQYSEAAVRVALAPSRSAVAAIATMAAATLALVLLTPGAPAVRILAATWVACAALHALHVVALHRGRRGVRALRIDGDGAIELRDGTGASRAGLLRDGSFVAPWLAIVRWRAPGARFDASVVILPDMLPAEDFRHLRVRLRWS